MSKISVGGSGRDLHVEISRGHLVGRADESADWSNEPIGPREPEPDRGKQHRQGQQHEDDREAQFERVTMGLEATKQIRDAPGIGRMPTKVLPTPKNPQSASPLIASWKSDGSGFAISFSSDPSAIWIGVPSLFISAAALKPNTLERELK